MATIKTMERIDIVNARELEKSINEAIEGQASDLCIDMSGTKFICSVGLRILLAATKTLKEKNQKLILKGVIPQVMEIFDVTGFTNILNFEE